jgi:competence ComEA-like helix-hairpin-helix protein
MTEERWANTVDVMVARGANGTDEEIDLVVAYLAKNFGPPAAAHKINVNRATAKDLAAGLGLTGKECDAIVQYREKNGDFKNLADLRKVPEIPSKTVDDMKDRVEF